MNRVVAVGVLVASINSLTLAGELRTSQELRFQNVVPVPAATRNQIYDAALDWFSEAFQGPKASVEQNRLAGLLTGRGAERYVPPFLSTACTGWIRYRVTLLAKDGRYDWTVDGFTHEGDSFCNKRSFGLLTTNWLSETITRTIFDMTLQRPGRASAELEAWIDMKEKATAIAEKLSRSLRQKLAVAARKPAASHVAAADSQPSPSFGRLSALGKAHEEERECPIRDQDVG